MVLLKMTMLILIVSVMMTGIVNGKNIIDDEGSLNEKGICGKTCMVCECVCEDSINGNKKCESEKGKDYLDCRRSCCITTFSSVSARCTKANPTYSIGVMMVYVGFGLLLYVLLIIACVGLTRKCKEMRRDSNGRKVVYSLDQSTILPHDQSLSGGIEDGKIRKDSKLELQNDALVQSRLS